MQQLTAQFRQMGGALRQRGLLLAAREVFQLWLAEARKSGQPAQLISPLNALATVEMDQKDYHAAAPYLQEAADHMEDPSAPPADRLKCLLNLCMANLQTGSLNQALSYGLAAEEQATKVGSPFFSGLACLDLSLVYLRQSDWPAAQRAARKALRHFALLKDGTYIARTLNNLALAEAETGQYEQAHRDLSRALAFNSSMKLDYNVVYNHVSLGRLALKEGKVEEALEHGRTALDGMLGHIAGVDKGEVAEISELFGIIFAGSRSRNLALKYLNRAAAYYSQLGRLHEWSRVTRQIGELLMGRSGGEAPELRQEQGHLDFLTAVLDITDDVESIDSHLRGHSERVARYAILLGRHIGLPAQTLSVLGIAARLHDVGYVAVDAEILQSPGPLTPAQRKRMEMHPVVGEELLRPYGLAEEGLEAIRYHHEWWNGGGYPAGIKGEQIPLLARLIHVTDVYDALVSARPHRQPHPHSEAMIMLKDLAGKQLDAQLVDAFRQMHQV